MEQSKRAGETLAEITDLHALQQRLLENNICVNGCGPLHWTSSQDRKCSVCGFRHYGFPQPHLDTNVRPQGSEWLELEASGRCPNGHGAMTRVDCCNVKCLTCGHNHFGFPGV